MSNVRDNQDSKPAVRFKGFSDAWEQRKLSDLTESHNSGVYIPKDQYGEGTNIIGVGDIYDSDVVDGQRYRLAPVKDKRFILHTNDLLYGESSLVPEGIARVVSVSEAGAGTAFAWHTRRFKVNQVTLNSRFLGLELDYWLPARSHLMRSSTKTALTGITTQDFFNTQIVFPSKPEQEKIATLINSLDTAIALHQRKVENLQKLKKSLLQQMFVSGNDQVPKIRFKGFTDAWEQRKLGNTKTTFTDGNYGESYPTALDMTNQQLGVPFLRGSDLKDGLLSDSHANFITKEKHAELTSGHVKSDDVVLAVRGSLGSVGYACPANDGWNINSQLAIIRTNKRELLGFFVAQFLMSHQGQKQILSRNTGTALKQLPINQLKEIFIPVPSLDEQAQISRAFTLMSNVIALHQRKVENLQKLKKSLLRLMFI